MDDRGLVQIVKKLGLDLGGIHGVETGTIDFDMKRNELQIALGSNYQLDVFHAERHTTQSNFRMATTIDCFIIQ